MTEEPILEWLDLVWKRWQGALLCKLTVMVLDSICEHITETVKAEVNENSDLVIFDGITKLLQPLDSVINWPFNVAN
jgi:hypothetical protein